MSAKSKKVYITRRIPEPGVKALKDAGCKITIWDRDEAIPKEELKANVKDVDGVLCMLTDNIDAEILEAAGKFLIILFFKSTCLSLWFYSAF